MEAVDWTALSVLTAVVLGALGYVVREMHRLEVRLEARFEAGFDAIERRLDAIDRRFDLLEERYVRHLEAHAAH
jgi:hypothetical protein